MYSVDQCMKYGYTCLLMNNDDQTDTTLVTLATLSIYRCVYLTSTIKSVANVHLSWSAPGSSKIAVLYYFLVCTISLSKSFLCVLNLYTGMTVLPMNCLSFQKASQARSTVSQNSQTKQLGFAKPCPQNAQNRMKMFVKK